MMGGGQPGHFSCPSNLNIEVLRLVFRGETGAIRIPASAYGQAEEC
jgi:hypothetical protein